jgi:hypothetical protein
MKNFTRLFLVLYFGLFSFVQVLSAQTLKDQMSPEAFEKAGLDKLSTEELAYLSNWLAGKVEEEKEKVVAEIIPVGDDRFGAAEKIQRNVDRIRPEPKELSSRIIGSFSGWSGNTVFELENGQVWKQIERDKFSVRLQDPTVTVEKGLFGAYFLKVKGFGSRVKVKRLK